MNLFQEKSLLRVRNVMLDKDMSIVLEDTGHAVK